MTLRAAIAGLAAIALGTAAASAAEDEGSKVYQLRTYRTAPGKLPVLLDRFEAENLPLFEEHGIALVGAWTPAEGDEGGDRLVYLASFPSKEAGESAWKAFSDDPHWKEIFSAEQEEHGMVVTDVEAVYLAPTDYSPDPSSADAQGPPTEDGRLYELRRYSASPGKLGDLNRRFREHTLDLFAKHGMTNVVYTTPMDGEPGSGETLVYLVSHASRADALNSWESFRGDAEWQQVYRESQPDGVRLAAEVESTDLVPTPFSPLE